MDLHLRITNHNSLNTEFKTDFKFIFFRIISSLGIHLLIVAMGEDKKHKVKKVQTSGDEMSTMLTE